MYSFFICNISIIGCIFQNLEALYLYIHVISVHGLAIGLCFLFGLDEVIVIFHFLNEIGIWTLFLKFLLLCFMHGFVIWIQRGKWALTIPFFLYLTKEWNIDWREDDVRFYRCNIHYLYRFFSFSLYNLCRSYIPLL